MSPGGHLVTTALACGAVHALTGSTALTAGVAAGGFLVDLDHVVDYVLFEARRDLRPAAFLRYYMEQRTRRLVLLLHSYELLALLALLAWMANSEALWGYVLGVAGLHLPLDIVFNGRVLSRNLVPFYSFAYRWRSGFRAEPLIGVTAPVAAPGGFWRSFFAELARRRGRVQAPAPAGWPSADRRGAAAPAR
jgi:hypothetical protein